MWNFYDELGIGIPSGILVEGCVVGKYWTTVRANGNIGVARTLGNGAGGQEAARAVMGRALRDVANHMRWSDLTLASIGVAAYNSFYNTAERAAALAAPPAFEGELAGKRVTVVGELPALEARLRGCAQVAALPLPEPGQVDGRYALDGDFVFLSGDTLTNRTLPDLLKRVEEGTKVSLAGVSVPAAPVLFAFDNPIHNLSGVYAVFDTTVEGAALHDISDLTPGVKEFSASPMPPQYIKDADEVRRYQSSPYRSAAFNSAFNPWVGKDYDPDTWPPVFRG